MDWFLYDRNLRHERVKDYRKGMLRFLCVPNVFPLIIVSNRIKAFEKNSYYNKQLKNSKRQLRYLEICVKNSMISAHSFHNQPKTFISETSENLFFKKTSFSLDFYFEAIHFSGLTFYEEQ